MSLPSTKFKDSTIPLSVLEACEFVLRQPRGQVVACWNGRVPPEVHFLPNGDPTAPYELTHGGVTEPVPVIGGLKGMLGPGLEAMGLEGVSNPTARIPPTLGAEFWRLAFWAACKAGVMREEAEA